MTSGKSHKKHTTTHPKKQLLWLAVFLPEAKQLLAAWHEHSQSNTKCKKGTVTVEIFPTNFCRQKLPIVTCLGTPIWKAGIIMRYKRQEAGVRIS